MANTDIRTKAKNNGVFLWEIANAFGVSEATITRHLRTELPDEKKALYFKAIDTIVKSRK